MNPFLGTSVFAVLVFGALALPSPSNLKASENEVAKASTDQTKDKRHIFGIDFDINLMKNTTLIPDNSFINLSTNYGDNWGLGGGLNFPSYFPLSLIIPPFNLTYELTKFQQANLDIEAGAGNYTKLNVSKLTTPAPGWASPSTPGWSPPPTTASGWAPPPTTAPGWSQPSTTTPGWSPTPTTSGWAPPQTSTPGWSPPSTTTPGWSPPSTTTSGWLPPPTTSGWAPPQTSTPGWSPPPTTTPGWSAPETTTTSGWSPPPTTTSGWSAPETTTTPGWSPPPETTTPGWSPPPPESTTTQGGWTSPPSTSSGWIPGGKEVQDEPVGIIWKGAPGLVPNKPVSLPGEKPKPQPPILQIAENSLASGKEPGGEIQNFMVDIAQSAVSSELPGPDPEEVEETEGYNPVYYSILNGGNTLEPLPAMSVAQDAIPGDEERKKSSVEKVRRHAERRASDDDSESFADPEEKELVNCPNSGAPDLKKSEPAPSKPAKGSHSNSHGSKGTSGQGGKNRPRPYGMDRPSRTRPILGQDKNSHRPDDESSGPLLIHHQKEEIPIMEDGPVGEGASLFGFQVPIINWSSFTDIFESFMGSRTVTKAGAMFRGKSDDSGEKCVEDEEQVDMNLRTQREEFEGGRLCGADREGETREVKRNLCGKACAKNGFAGGNCVIRQDLMPGCLCRMPNSREYGMMLELFRQAEPEEDASIEDDSIAAAVADQSEKVTKSSNQNQPCKRCACMEACKKQGSFTGFCAEKCFCSNPWYTMKHNTTDN